MRRRDSENRDDERQVGERRKVKKLRYSKLREDWGATTNMGEEPDEQTISEDYKSEEDLGEEQIVNSGGAYVITPAPPPINKS